MKFLFRADASLSLGTGHLRRTRHIAERLRACGREAEFIVHQDTVQYFSEILDGYRIHQLPSIEALEQTTSLLACQQEATLIVDSYALNQRWEECIRPYVRHLVVIDDLNRQHSCDLIIDHNFRSNYAGYYDQVPLKFLGPDYCLINENFSQIRSSLSPILERPQRAFICFGGCSNEEILLRTIHVLSNTKWQATIVTGAGSLSSEVIKLSEQYGYSLYREIRDVSELMASCQIAIGAGGTMNWERLCLGLPSIVISVAENQEQSSSELHEAKYIHYLGRSSEVTNNILSSAIQTFISDKELLRSFSHRGCSLVDGRGVERLLRQLLTYG